MNNRRKFLFDCSTLTLAAGLLPSTLMAAAAKTPAREAGFAGFAAQQGTVFTVSSPATRAVRLELVSACLNPSKHPLAHLAPDARNEKFTLIFRASRPVGLKQDTYAFEHPELGRQDIFIVPAKVNGSNQEHYAAVFNRPSPAI